ncbi:poly [ADP-ribose] polymerase tankyrase-like [Sitodiplosis mosellana]|uniref:poly [ADP-ribose] polymerase tankyrase-like n=1 Tax=Sitodiplosis mosellana TaxID=263140 RepID=UPI0024451C19|nr:poly [ADP-ribose] polymerase tankyrase-like [Sitodiplosis mosellana]
MLSRRSFTLLLLSLVASMFLIVDVSGAPSVKKDEYESDPTFISVKDRVKAFNDRTKYDDRMVPPSKLDSPKSFAKPIMMGPNTHAMKSGSKVQEAKSYSNYYSAKKSFGEPNMMDPTLQTALEKAKAKQGMTIAALIKAPTIPKQTKPAERPGVNAMHTIGEPALCKAAGTGNTVEVKKLINEGANVNIGNEFKVTPLHYAAENGDIDVAEELINNGADVNIGNNLQITPLHYAAMDGHMEVVKLFIRKGAKVNYGNHFHMTALHYAAMNGHKDIAEYLIAKGADVHLQDALKRTPFQFAVQYGHKELAHYLFGKM